MNSEKLIEITFFIFVIMVLVDWAIHLTQTMPTIRRHRKTSFFDWTFAGPHQIRNLNDYKKYLDDEGAPLTWFYIRQGLLLIAVIAMIGFIVSMFSLGVDL